MTVTVNTAIEILGEYESGTSTHGINLCVESHDGVTLTADEAEELGRALLEAAALLRDRDSERTAPSAEPRDGQSDALAWQLACVAKSYDDAGETLVRLQLEAPADAPGPVLEGRGADVDEARCELRDRLLEAVRPDRTGGGSRG